MDRGAWQATVCGVTVRHDWAWAQITKNWIIQPLGGSFLIPEQLPISLGLHQSGMQMFSKKQEPEPSMERGENNAT